MNCEIKKPFKKIENGVTWNYFKEGIPGLIFSYLCISIVYIIYLFINKKSNKYSKYIYYTIIISILYLLYLFNTDKMNLMYIPSFFISNVINTPVFLNKDEYFHNYTLFENKDNYNMIKNEVMKMLNITNNGNSISLTRDKEGGYNSNIGKNINIDSNGVERGWRVLNIKFGDTYSQDAFNYFPFLTSLLDKIPEVKVCAISILEAGVVIPIHTGYYKGIMRYLLPIKVPDDKDNIFLCANGEKYNWIEGDGVLWDDMYPHEVYNNTKETRVVIYMDIARPFDGIFKTINNKIIEYAINSEDIQREIKKTEIQVKI